MNTAAAVYELAKNAVQLDTLAIVQYLAHRPDRPECTPCRVYERNHPAWASCLPAIRDARTGQVYAGMRACERFYEHAFDEPPGLAARALAWKRCHPAARVTAA